MLSRSGYIPLSHLLATGRRPGARICIDGNVPITWGTFSAKVGGLLRELRRRPEKRWAVCCTSPLSFGTALLAVWHAGGVPILLPNAQPGTLAVLRNTFDAILADATLASVDNTLRVDAVAPVDIRIPAIDARARLELFTSGSSGDPKPVEKSLVQLDAEVSCQDRLWGELMGAATVVATVPCHHIYGLLFRLLLPLTSGRCFDTVTCNSPETLFTRLREVEQAIIVSSPALLSRLPDLLDLEAIAPFTRLILSSGGPLPQATAVTFKRRLGSAPLEIYGSTETGGIAWRRRDEGEGWTALTGVEIAAGERGELCIRSPFLPDDRWLSLEDGAEILAGDRFLLKGRLDRVVKVEEKRLSLPDMEELLRQHPWVANAGVVELPVTAGKRKLLGAVVALNCAGRVELDGSGRRAVAAELARHLASCFDATLLPRRWRFPDELPADERGKLPAASLLSFFAGEDDDTSA